MKISLICAPIVGDDSAPTRGYLDLLDECFRDELWGARFFALLSHLRKGAARERAVLAVLAVLEETMQEILTTLLRHHGQSWDQLAYEEQANVTACEFAQYHGGSGWQDILAGIERAIPVYSTKHSELLDQAPSHDHVMVKLFVEHEGALLAFARLEQDAENDLSLQLVWRVLEKAQRLARSRL